MSAALDALVARAQSRLELLEAAHAELSGGGAKYRTPDGVVTAEVNATGSLCGLQLADRATELEPDELAAAIVTAAAAAAQTAARRHAETIEQLMACLTDGAADVLEVTAAVPYRSELE